MYCKNCGTEMNCDTAVCPNCGTPKFSVTPTAVIQTVPTNSSAVAGFVLALIGMFFFGIFSLLGLIFSAKGLSQLKETGEKGNGMAIAGIVLSIIGLVVTAVFVIIIASTVSLATHLH